MEISIRKARETDIDYLLNMDEHVEEAWIRRCQALDEYLLAEVDGKLRAFMRYSFFWGDIPYMDMIWVEENFRRKGVGSALIHFWTKEMKALNKGILMTSAMSNEPPPLAWHKRNGFVESGRLTFGGLQEIPEVFLVKELD